MAAPTFACRGSSRDGVPLISALIARIRGNPGLLAGFLAQALQYGAGLMLMPFVVSRLTPAQVGIWYVFLAAQSLAAVADFGFQPTLARFFALARSGAQEITRHGLGKTGNGEPNIPLTRALLGAARKLYLALAGGIFLLLAVFGTLYIAELSRKGGLPVQQICGAWLIFALAIAANLYFLWIPAFLLGSGRVVQNYAFLILSRGGFALFGIIIIVAGGGLTGLAIGFLTSQLAARAVAWFLLRNTVAAHSRSWNSAETRPVLSAIWPNASRLGLVGIGAFLISRYNVFLISSSLGLATSAQYAICLQILNGIASVAQLPAQARLSDIVNARVGPDNSNLRKLVISSWAFYWFLFLCSSIFVIAFASPALAHIGSKVSILQTSPFAMLAMVVALEGFHSLNGFIITTRNAVPFVLPALLSGVGVAISASLAVHFGYGVIGVILCQGMVQIAYNNWKWPFMVYQEIKK